MVQKTAARTIIMAFLFQRKPVLSEQLLFGATVRYDRVTHRRASLLI
jgi:hypothetical protein